MIYVNMYFLCTDFYLFINITKKCKKKDLDLIIESQEKEKWKIKLNTEISDANYYLYFSIRSLGFKESKYLIVACFLNDFSINCLNIFQ